MKKVMDEIGNLVRKVIGPNRFKDHLYQVVDRHKAMEAKVISFSAVLRSAMGLDRDDLKLAEHERVTWDVGPWRIHPESRCFQDGWVTVLEVTPNNTANDDRPEVDDAWYVESRGTASIILPSADVQKEVLDLITKEFGGKPQ